ncbi:MAG TPA: hypothetical protein VL261_00805 [Nitrospira sp.]|jgi:hypothetical protein|nr:hypothetical protein [Nitrospira sp.]
MQTIFLVVLATLLTSCLFAPREREAHCLGLVMLDLRQADEELTAAEEAWRRAREVSAQRSAASAVAHPIADGNLPVFLHNQTGIRRDNPVLSFRTEEEQRLYGRMIAARAGRAEAAKSYRLLARRLETRMEEDDMLYPVLGMLATSTAIVLYPLVRYNVRSVLWDGVDPDAEDDPVQRFCVVRLEEAQLSRR